MIDDAPSRRASSLIGTPSGWLGRWVALLCERCSVPISGAFFRLRYDGSSSAIAGAQRSPRRSQTWHGLAPAIRRGLPNMKIRAYLTAPAINLKRLAATLLVLILPWIVPHSAFAASNRAMARVLTRGHDGAGCAPREIQRPLCALPAQGPRLCRPEGR